MERKKLITQKQNSQLISSRSLVISPAHFSKKKKLQKIRNISKIYS